MIRDLASGDRGFAGLILLTLLRASWRVDYRRPPAGRAGRPRGLPVLYCLWHGRQIPLVLSHRREGVTSLVSLNRDGDYVSKVVELLGFPVIRGSSSRGGLEALRRMASVLRSGVDCSITPDGPRGPVYRAKAGLVQISRLGRRPAVPIASSGYPAAIFHSWDSFRLPLPLARMVVVEGRAVPPPPGGVKASQAALHIEHEMMRVTRLADFLSDPSGRLFEAASETAGRLLGPAAAAAIIRKPWEERRQRMGIVASRADRPVWMHGSSAGEINGLLPLAVHLRERGVPVHLTCFTPAGREAVERSGVEGSFLPLDNPDWVGRFLRAVGPRALVLAETEIWPNLLLRTLLASVPCISVNARISAGSLRGYRLLAGGCVGRLLSCFCAVLCRTGDDAARFRALGVDPSIIEVTGDTKALNDPGDPPAEWRERLSDCGPVLVAGSTRPGEEEAVAAAAREAGLYPVIAPRHLERLGEVEAALGGLGFSIMRWSEPGPPPDDGCMIVDSRGMLSRLYGCATVAFVGGTIAPFGGHNILEPLLRGIPTVVGPNHGSFAREVAKGVEIGAVAVSDPDGLSEALRRMMTCGADPAATRDLGMSPGREALGRFEEALRRAGVWI